MFGCPAGVARRAILLTVGGKVKGRWTDSIEEMGGGNAGAEIEDSEGRALGVQRMMEDLTGTPREEIGVQIVGRDRGDLRAL